MRIDGSQVIGISIWNVELPTEARAPDAMRRSQSIHINGDRF